LIESDTTPVTLHDRVELPPALIVDGLAVKLAMDAGGTVVWTVTVAVDESTLPPALVTRTQ
jgi:hypothetical protein